jgi:K+-transporting ATPase KdpF subunit
LVHRRLRKADGGSKMNVLYIIVGLITLILFVYLVLALVKPEWFG